LTTDLATGEQVSYLSQIDGSADILATLNFVHLQQRRTVVSNPTHSTATDLIQHYSTATDLATGERGSYLSQIDGSADILATLNFLRSQPQQTARRRLESDSFPRVGECHQTRDSQEYERKRLGALVFRIFHRANVVYCRANERVSRSWRKFRRRFERLLHLAVGSAHHFQ
jgi:hypothetical protein